MSHPEFFLRQFCDPSFGPGNSGQPGYTPNEQARFKEACEGAHGGALVDAFRRVHPEGTPGKEGWTWRGTAGTRDGGKARGSLARTRISERAICVFAPPRSCGA